MTPTELSRNMVPTYTVISRHSADCPHKKKGLGFIDCDCRKWIRVYDPRILDPKRRQTRFLDPDGSEYPAVKGTHKGHSPFSVKTRSAEEAGKIAKAYRDLHDPRSRALAEKELEIKQLKEAQRGIGNAITIEKSVAMFLASKKAERISPKRIERYLPLLGDVDPEAVTFKRNRRGNEGRLPKWLKTLNPQPIFVSDLTPVLIESFRNTWDFNSDLTDFGTFGDLKRFLNYCFGKGWIKSHPMAGMKPPKVKRGSRTTAFSDQQYDSILDAINKRFPAEIKNLEDQKRHDDAHRLLAFVELMRWGGLALGDAVTFKLDSMNSNGEVTYYRLKTKRRAQPTLLPHVVNLLKATIPIDGALNQPFYDKTVDPDANTGRWARELKSVFADAGIESVKTDIREREPHSHMFRDTFAVGQLRTQYELGMVNHKAVADALGDTVAIMLKHYAPWIEEFERAHKEAQRRIVEAQAAKLAQKQAKNGRKILEIEFVK